MPPEPRSDHSTAMRTATPLVTCSVMIETGARSAALGGFTAVVAMPNTEPPLDDAAVVGSVLAAGARSTCDVASSGCITKGRAGTELAPMGELGAGSTLG